MKTSTNRGTVYFNHGKESGPWGSKISKLAGIAEQNGFFVESLDYQYLQEPCARVERLLQSGAAGAAGLEWGPVRNPEFAVSHALLKRAVSGRAPILTNDCLVPPASRECRLSASCSQSSDCPQPFWPRRRS